MNPFLAQAAAHERHQRAERYPGRVLQGKISAEEANADYAAWCAITAWLEGNTAQALAWCTFGEMAMMAGRAVISLSAAAERGQTDRKKADRRDAVACIYARLQAHHSDLVELNAQLRAGTTTGQEAVA